MTHDPINFVELAARRGYVTTGRSYVAAEGGPFAELVKIDSRLHNILMEIRTIYPSDDRECPIRLWNGDSECIGWKNGLASILEERSPEYKTAADYLYGNFKLCLHCLGRKLIEADLERDLTRRLQHESLARRPTAGDVQNQITTPFGRADIVTKNFVYEVKLHLTRAAIFQAIGQATVYAQALGKVRIGIAGQRTRDLDILLPALQERGITVLVWDYQKIKRRDVS